MRALKFYFDEDAMETGLVFALRRERIDVVTPSEVGLMSATDEAHLTFAFENDRVLYSFNAADFCRIHLEWSATSRPYAGIIISCQQRYSVGEQMRRILRIGAQRNAARMRNCLEFLSKWG